MNLDSVIEELKSESARLERAIAPLVSSVGPKAKPVRSTRARRRRESMSAAFSAPKNASLCSTFCETASAPKTTADCQYQSIVLLKLLVGEIELLR